MYDLPADMYSSIFLSSMLSFPLKYLDLPWSTKLPGLFQIHISSNKIFQSGILATHRGCEVMHDTRTMSLSFYNLRSSRRALSFALRGDLRAVATTLDMSRFA